MKIERLNYTAENCSVAATLELVGDKWSLLILREAFFGLRRYEEFLKLTGCARNILSQRLAKMVEHGLLQRVAYREAGQRERYEYHLTEKGFDLFPAIVALMQWGDRWLADKSGGPAIVCHKQCGASVTIDLNCANGHKKLNAKDAYVVPGKTAKLISALKKD